MANKMDTEKSRRLEEVLHFFRKPASKQSTTLLEEPFTPENMRLKLEDAEERSSERLLQWVKQRTKQ